jgi:nucleotide-binding universal stress UspA family protein
LGFSGVDPKATGRPSYHPSVLLKLYIYGYLNRVQSSRRLEREAGRNVEVMWLTGRLVPDHKTIADFRKNNGPAIRRVCSQFVALCRQLGFCPWLDLDQGRPLVIVIGNKPTKERGKRQRRSFQMYKNIIVPIDLDKAENGKVMLDKVKELADEGGKVTVVNVVEDMPGLITAEIPEELIQKAALTGRSSLVDMVKAAGLTADVQIRSGRPHRAIVNLADEIGADLVLIASRDPGVQDYLLGSTAAGVVRHAKCSVLVAR